jgi:hypothetical protein
MTRMARCGAAFGLVAWVGLASTSGCAHDKPPAPAALVAEDPQLAPLSFLTGSWVGFVEGARVEEHWTHPAGASMLGMSRTVAGGRTKFFEFLRIEVQDGEVALLASPLGRDPPTRFPMKQLQDQGVVFENLQHDFPQRVVYHRDGDRLVARVEGEQAGKLQVSEWVYLRAQN